MPHTSSAHTHLCLKRRPGKAATYLVKIEMSKKGAPKSAVKRSALRTGRRGLQPPKDGPERTAKATEISQLIDKVRQVIDETPDIRDEKVAAVQEAVEQGTYKVDARRLANILLAKLLLDS